MTDNTKIIDTIKNELDSFISETKKSINEVNKVAASQAWKILQLAIAITIQLLQNLAVDLSGPDKKIIAMNVLSEFYDKVFVVVYLPFVPSSIEPFVRKYVKAFLMTLVSSSIDAMVTTFKQLGIFKSEKAVASQSIKSKNKRVRKKK
jgi:hypothetical protein